MLPSREARTREWAVGRVVKRWIGDVLGAEEEVVVEVVEGVSDRLVRRSTWDGWVKGCVRRTRLSRKLLVEAVDQNRERLPRFLLSIVRCYV